MRYHPGYAFARTILSDTNAFARHVHSRAPGTLTPRRRWAERTLPTFLRRSHGVPCFHRFPSPFTPFHALPRPPRSSTHRCPARWSSSASETTASAPTSTSTTRASRCAPAGFGLGLRIHRPRFPCPSALCAPQRVLRALARSAHMPLANPWVAGSTSRDPQGRKRDAARRGLARGVCAALAGSESPFRGR